MQTLFFSFLKMDKIIQIERLRYEKICGERRFFHDLWIPALEKVKTWNHKRHYPPISSSVFFSEAAPHKKKLSLKVAVLEFCKISWKTLAVDFCFSCRGTKYDVSKNKQLWGVYCVLNVGLSPSKKICFICFNEGPLTFFYPE